MEEGDVFAFEWKDITYRFKWKQVVLSHSVDLLESVALRKDSVYNADVYVLFQLANIDYPRDAQSTQIILQTYGVEMHRRFPFIQGHADAHAALQALHHWLTQDERSIAQYQAARYVYCIAYCRWTPSRVALHSNFQCFGTMHSRFYLAKNVYMRFFTQLPEKHNETLETIFVLMCHISARALVGQAFEAVLDLDNYIGDTAPWKYAELCRKVYRAMIHYRVNVIGDRQVLCLSRSKRNIVQRNKSKITSVNKHKNLLDLLGVEVPKNIFAVRCIMADFMWCIMAGAWHVRETDVPEPYLHIL